MSTRAESVGGGDSVLPRSTRRVGLTPNTESQGSIVEKLTTPAQWLQAAQTGRVNFLTVMANEDRIPPEDFDAVVTSCGDVPTF